MDPAFTPVKSETIIKIDDFEDYCVLFNPLTAETMGLNSTGLFIWDNIDGFRTIPEIAQIVWLEFSVDFEAAEKDVLSLIRKLHRRMFITFLEQDHFELNLSESL